MIVRIDARRPTDSARLHAAVAEAFGFFAGYGKNLDALIDCLSHLDDPAGGMSQVHVFPGRAALLAIDHVQGAGRAVAEQVQALADAVAFVNWRRLERGQPPVLAVAYDRG